jgi:DNA-directed RNA polymerase subunit RPC12/RpoP
MCTQGGKTRPAMRMCAPCGRSTKLSTSSLIALCGAELAIPELKRRLTCSNCGDRARELRILPDEPWVGSESDQKLGFAVVPGSADFIRPSVIPAPAINGAIERSALTRRWSGDTRQPFTVRIPAVLFAIGGLLARATFLLEIRCQ